ncbi:MAG: peptide chain release factor N(5)-glutamine methyltransferase [Candidatus Actinomarina sp.]
MDIKNIPEHELARLREKAKELAGSTTDYQTEYSSLLTRRVNHEPLQYIEEYVPFYSISLKVDERCLIPRPETEYLIQIIKENVERPKKVLDVGTGSGCIALMMKSIFPNSEVTGIDISEDAIELANENSKLNTLDVSFFQSNLLENVEERDHDLIVANLPYIPTENLNELDREVIDYEPLTALNGGKDGLEIISNLINGLEERDYEGVNLFLEIDSRKSPETLELLKSWDEVKLLQDLAEKDRYVFAKR